MRSAEYFIYGIRRHYIVDMRVKRKTTTARTLASLSLKKIKRHRNVDEIVPIFYSLRSFFTYTHTFLSLGVSFWWIIACCALIYCLFKMIIMTAYISLVFLFLPFFSFFANVTNFFLPSTLSPTWHVNAMQNLANQNRSQIEIKIVFMLREKSLFLLCPTSIFFSQF